jgi:hypothetical protein
MIFLEILLTNNNDFFELCLPTIMIFLEILLTNNNEFFELCLPTIMIFLNYAYQQ